MYHFFIAYRRSQCLYLSAKLSASSSSSSDVIFSISNESKKEPVQSQQILVKRDCDSEAGLKNSFIIATETWKNLSEGNKQFLVKEIVIPRQVSLVPFHPRCVSFSSANCSIPFSLSCLSVDNISFTVFWLFVYSDFFE